MEHQGQRASVQFGRAGDSGYGSHLAVPHRRQAGGGAHQPLVINLRSPAASLELA